MMLIRPTAKLRWVKRTGGLVLQQWWLKQKWTGRYMAPDGGEWQDVPIEKEEEGDECATEEGE